VRCAAVNVVNEPNFNPAGHGSSDAS
jgi:hypothetical protein